jgi:hypothetical protein
MGKAILKISVELLERLLRFPDNANVIFVSNYNSSDRSVELGIISPDLPRNIEGAELPETDYIVDILEDGSLSGRFVLNEQSTY